VKGAFDRQMEGKRDAVGVHSLLILITFSVNAGHVRF
jgi:hypothetical protein